MSYVCPKVAAVLYPSVYIEVGGNCPLTSPNWTAARLTSTSLPIGCYCMGVTKTRSRKRNGKRNETENTAHVLA